METLGQKVVYRNRWMSVREDEVRHPDGVVGVFGVVDKPRAALIIPVEGDGFHLVEQFRYPLGRRTWEFPQGTWPDGRVTGTEELARAELAQETGLRAAVMERVGGFAIAGGMSSQGCDVFLASGLTAGPPDRDPEEQNMRQRWFGRAEFEAMIRDGRLDDGPTLAAYTQFLLR